MAVRQGLSLLGSASATRGKLRPSTNGFSSEGDDHPEREAGLDETGRPEKKERGMTEATRTAILYARVSTRAQSEEGYSLRQQVEALRRWAEAEGYEVLEVVEESGHSGASLERPGLDRVRDRVAEGGVSVVLAQDRDR